MAGVEHELFPDVSAGEPVRRCLWCGDSPTSDFELEPARYGVERITRVRVLKKSAIVAQACRECATRMTPQEAAPGVT